MKKWIPLLIGGLIGVVIGLGIVWAGVTVNLSGGQLFIGLLVSILAIFIQIVIHEGGHLLGGLLTGYSFVSFRVFSLMIQKTPVGIEFKRQKVPGTAGQCLMGPPEYIKGEFPFKLYLLGGGLANILVSLLALILGFIFPNVGFYFLVFALIGFLLGLANLIPSGFNDGMSLKLTWRNEKIQELFYQQLYLNQQMAQGIPLSEIPEQYFYLPDKIAGKSFYEVWTFFVAYTRELEKGSLEKGKEILDRLWEEREQLILPYQVSLDIEMVYCLTVLDLDASLAQQLFEKRQNQPFLRMKTMGNERVKGAYALYIEQDSQKAIDHCQLGLSYQKANPILTDAMMEEQLLWQIQETAKERLND